MAELRADLLEPEELSGVGSFPSRLDIPVILTVRRCSDGGRWEGSESRRRNLLSLGAQAGYSFIDLEGDLPSLGWEARWSRSGRIIRSLHCMNDTPSDPSKVLCGLPRTPSEIPKLATTPTSDSDTIRIFDSSEAIRRELGTDARWILLGMGEYGVHSRILAGRMGCWFTFASVGERGAPGQMTPEILETLFRYSDITSQTPLYGIIGSSVGHSLSPRLHNIGLAHLGLQGVYIPIKCDSPERFLPWAQKEGFRGLSVTIPHKERVIPLLSSQEPSVEAIGACNTVIRSKEGGWHGLNTDSTGFLTPLLERYHGELSGKRVVVVGAGGAARAIVYALKSVGASVVIRNRGHERGRRLAEEFSCDFLGLAEGWSGERPDVVVQTTSVGMTGVDDAYGGDPLRGYTFEGSELVYDIVYTPRETPLLSRARRAGCRIISGIEMLEHQGMEQFRLFTGHRYPFKSIL